MNRNRTIALAGLAAATGLAPLAIIPAHAQGPTSTVAAATSTTYSVQAPRVQYLYRAPGMHATITITQVAGVMYHVDITGQADQAAGISVPVSNTSGLMVPVRQQRMASGHGQMNLTTSAAVFTFDKSYLASFGGPFSFSGSWDVVVTSGQTGTQTITVGGRAYPITIKTPAAQVTADGQGRRLMETQTFEIERTTITNNATAKKFLAIQDDGLQKYGEGTPLYKNAAYRPYFTQQFTFFTAQVPKNATPAELLAAINRAKPKGYDTLTTTARQKPTGQRITRKTPLVITTVNRLDVAHGAKPIAKGALAWGPKHNLAETYVASSNHR